MDENKIMIVETGEELLAILQASVASYMSEMQDHILTTELPKREDFATEAEYQEMKREYMQFLVYKTELVKRDIFQDILNSYNDFLTEKNSVEIVMKKQAQQEREFKVQSSYAIKRIGIESVAISLLLPYCIPIVLIINVPRIGLNLGLRKAFEYRTKHNNELSEKLKDIQIPLFDFTCDLRSDYHKSKKELKELEAKAEAGESVVAELYEILDPSRVNLQRIEEKDRVLPIPEEESAKSNVKRQ